MMIRPTGGTDTWPVTNANAFRVHDGLELTGLRAWGPSTGAGTMKGLEGSVLLAGHTSYSGATTPLLDGPREYSRALVVEVVVAPIHSDVASRLDVLHLVEPKQRKNERNLAR